MPPKRSHTAANKKRPSAVVDLTAEDDVNGGPLRKHPRLSGGEPAAFSQLLPSGSASSTTSSSRVFSGSSQPLSKQSRASSSQPQPYLSAAFLEDEEDPHTYSLTQADDGPSREYYGSLVHKIVGCRYYNGVVSPGELTLVRREPNNRYDSNAIRVDNVLGDQIGHVPRQVAEKLARYMDANDVNIEIEIAGEKNYYDCPVKIRIYGTSEPAARAQLEQRLKNDKLVTATQLKQTKREADMRRLPMQLVNSASGGLGSHKKQGQHIPQVPSMEDLQKQSEVLQSRSGEDIAKRFAMNEGELAKMPMAPQPNGLKSQLLPYQRQGLGWMTKKEHPEFPAAGSSNVAQLWKRDAKGRYVNVATSFATKTAPKLLSGGILADDMGLGKTLQIISLILTGGSGQTLIVAPMTVMSNWSQQVERHVHEEHRPKVLIHHGSGRGTTAKDLQGYNIVVTTYATLSSEYKNKSRGSPLFSTEWRRVVLDEGHTIRNASSLSAQAACGLVAQSRWVLSGTPIVNNVKDLHSLLKFLHITGGIETPEVFRAVITRGLSLGEPQAEIILQALMGDLCLRRNKEMKFVDLKLPAKTEYVHRIAFTPDEQKKYDALLLEAKGILEEYRNKQGKFQSVLERLLRLRQTCCHWTLCRQRIKDLMSLLEGEEVVELTLENRGILQVALRLLIESQDDCPVCLDTLDDPVITHCKHAFCRKCILKVIETQQKCPMCRNELSDESKVLEPAAETGGDEVLGLDGDDAESETKSSKTEALLKILQATLKNPESKVIIFSQWTSFLSVIQAELRGAGQGWGVVRIDGSMKTRERDGAIRALETDPQTRILLASLQVCSMGLNLVAADTVVLADSWWAPAIEDQAVDRVHRLGQTRPTTVWRLVVEGTVEERVLDIQGEKRELVSKAFREKRKGKGRQQKESRMADVLKLLG